MLTVIIDLALNTYNHDVQSCSVIDGFLVSL